jgi:2',3'-cyclic-nucleotide 2'-phosphodiesterase (5'-nucleotidase family)
VVRIWAETQDKKRVDRAPNTDATDSCAEPQYLTEVLQQTVLDPFAIAGTQAFDILRAPTRLFESAMGNLVADALLAGTPGAEVALTNSGGLRADLLCVPPASGEQPCEITWGELFGVLPFGNNTVIETVTGAQLEEALLNGLSPSCNPMVATGRFPQVAGLEVSYICVGTVPQIISINLRPGGMGGPAIPLAPGDSVRIVTNDFMYSGGDGYLVLTLGTDVVFTEVSLLELAGAYISVNSPVQPFVEGRIVKMAP